MSRPWHPDDDRWLTALDGRHIDVAVSIRDETVAMVVLGTDTITLTLSGARTLSKVLLSCADVLDGHI